VQIFHCIVLCVYVLEGGGPSLGLTFLCIKYETCVEGFAAAAAAPPSCSDPPPLLLTARRDHYFCSPQKGQADCGYAIAGNGVLAVFSLLILLLDAKVRVNGTKQRALLINALRLDENFCRLVQFCFPRWSDAVSTTSASEYDAI